MLFSSPRRLASFKPFDASVCTHQAVFEVIRERLAWPLDSMPIDFTQLPPAVQQRWRAMAKPAPEGYFELMDALAGWRGKDGRLDLMLGVDGPQRCTPRLLEMTGAYAEKHAMGLHTHLLEAKTQLMMAPPDTGGSLVALLDRYGLVGPRSSFAHFVWGSERDMALAAEPGTQAHRDALLLGGERHGAHRRVRLAALDQPAVPGIGNVRHLSDAGCLEFGVYIVRPAGSHFCHVDCPVRRRAGNRREAFPRTTIIGFAVPDGQACI